MWGGAGGKKEAIQINLRSSGLLFAFEYVRGKIGRISHPAATLSSFYSRGKSTCRVSSSAPGTEGDLGDNIFALQLCPSFFGSVRPCRSFLSLRPLVLSFSPRLRVGSFGSRFGGNGFMSGLPRGEHLWEAGRRSPIRLREMRWDAGPKIALLVSQGSPEGAGPLVALH